MIVSEPAAPASRSTHAQQAHQIAPLTHAEAGQLAQAEFRRLLPVMESLAGEDWAQPTYCSQWRTREVVAHLAGGVATFSTLREFLRHFVRNPHKKEFALPEDACNFLQVKERAGRTGEEVVREFRETAPKEMDVRSRLPWLLRQLPLPATPPMAIGHLTDHVLLRDWWIHRLDLCHATGRPMALTSEHDGRLTALVVREVARKLRRGLGQRQVELRLRGPAGGHFLVGKGDTPTVTLTLDTLDFHLRASERLSAAETLARATATGDPACAEWFLARCTVVY